MQVLAVSGSLRADSYNTRLLAEAAAAAPGGVEVELLDPALVAELPLYDQDLEGDAPASVERLREAWGGVDAILFATPEYNGSVPGGLKNAIHPSMLRAKGFRPTWSGRSEPISMQTRREEI